ncbi:MAG: Asp-tRNA(Asn)/Glu-tRNA(Gln) amidotransferase subunit GatA [bacterium]|nr:Asp-tRNA(Asn)/Glu-tRNA(Gln) amidotransferase subunit GatA [bacterium]
MTVREIRDAIRDGNMTAVQAVEESLRVIEEKDGEIGAFLEVFKEEALARAKELDERKAAGEDIGRLGGVPIALKDNILYKGHVASAASKVLEKHTAAYHATITERLLDAGVVIIGRTNMDDAAMGSSTETSAFKQTKNPFNLMKTPGGSSGGPAAAVAAGMVPAAIGTDTGGSIRQPAALCGVVGVKPTYGHVSRYGIIALSSSLDQAGPLTRTVEDAALILEVMHGKDEKDATSIDVPEVAIAEVLSNSLEGLRFGVPKEYFSDAMDQEVKARVEEAIENIKQAGGEVKEVSLPLMEYALPAYYIIQPAEASSNLGRYDGLRYGTRGKGALEDSYREARSLFGKEVKRRIMIGSYILSAGYYDAYYKKALAVRTAIHDEIEKVFEDVDMLVTPTSPSVAWNLGEKFDDPIAMYLADIYTVTANITGNPAISIPCGLAHDLPVGLQFIAPRGEDAKMLSVAHAFEKLSE